jgi:hypothetical protein
MRPEQRQEFFLKPELPVVGFLTRNIMTHRFHLGFAYCESAVSVLPTEAPELGELS